MDKKLLAWKLLHLVIIAHFVIEIAYTGYMVFAVLRPPGVTGPLFGAVADMDYELWMQRRLYAIENWIATAGLAVYLAITEIAPRWKQALVARVRAEAAAGTQ